MTLPRVVQIRQIKVYNRGASNGRINGAIVWVGIGLTGGKYENAIKVGTINFNPETSLYDFPGLDVAGSSVAVQGGHSGPLTLSEVEVFAWPGGWLNRIVEFSDFMTPSRPSLNVTTT